MSFNTTTIGTAEPDATGNITLNGAHHMSAVQSVSSSTTLTAPSGVEVLVLVTGAGVTLTLPSIGTQSIPRGARYQIKKTDAETMTIAAAAGETIDSASTYETGGTNESLTIVCDGSQWWLI